MKLDTLLNANLEKPQKPEVNVKPTPFFKKEQYNLEDIVAAFGRLPSSTTTTSTAVPDVSSVADHLNPDMKELLMSFGLIPNRQKTTEKPVRESLVVENYNPDLVETKPEAYLGFKPLPDDDQSRVEMRELLARFGLGRNTRIQKVFPKKEESQPQSSASEEVLNFDMIPEEYRETIEDIGLDNRKGISFI